MPSLPEIRAEVARLRRRAFVATFARELAGSTLVLAASLAVLVLGLHTFDRPLTPQPWWALGLLGPIAWAAWRARASLPDDAALAAHLDRRLGAGGLLISSLERGLGGWREDAEASLAQAAALAPRARVGREGLRTALAVAGVAALVWLPDVAPAGGIRGGSRAIDAALDDAHADLGLAEDAGLFGEDAAEELRRRAEELQERLLAGDPVAWDDVDALQDAIDRGQEAGAAGIRAVQAGADALAQEFARGGLEAGDLEELARLAQRASELGMLEDLPPEVRAALELLARHGGTGEAQGAEGSAGEGLDPSQLDPQRLRQLAEALKQQGGVRMQHAAGAARGDAPGADALRKMLEQQGILGPGAGPGELPVAQGGDGPFDPTPGPGGDGGPGSGGVSRGRGDAALQHAYETEVDTSGMRAERLPEGAAPPDRWDVAGVARAEPDVQPERPATGGADAGAAGVGDVTFRRDLAPRHREAVRRFFTDRAAGGR